MMSNEDMKSQKEKAPSIEMETKCTVEWEEFKAQHQYKQMIHIELLMLG